VAAEKNILSSEKPTFSEISFSQLENMIAAIQVVEDNQEIRLACLQQ